MDKFQSVRDLYDAHAKKVWRYAFAKLRNHQDADDCVQRTYVVVLEQYRKVKKLADPLNWIFGISANICSEMLRDRTKRITNEVPIEESNNEDSDIYAYDSITYEIEMRQYKETDVIEFVRRILPTKQFTLYKMRYLDGLTIDEIAHRSKLTYTAVTSQLSRIKEKIEEAMKKYFENLP